MMIFFSKIGIIMISEYRPNVYFRERIFRLTEFLHTYNSNKANFETHSLLDFIAC